MKFWILSLTVALSVIQVSDGLWKRKKYDLKCPSPSGQDLGTSGSYRRLGDFNNPYDPMNNEIPTYPEPRPRCPSGHGTSHHHHFGPGNENGLNEFGPDDPRRNEVDSPPHPNPRCNSGHNHHHHHHHHHHHPNDLDRCDSKDPQDNEAEQPPKPIPRCRSDGSIKPPPPPKPPRRNRPNCGPRDRADTV